MLSPGFDEFFRKGGSNQLGCSILTIRKFRKLLSLKNFGGYRVLEVRLLPRLPSHEPLVNYILRYRGFHNRLGTCQKLAGGEGVETEGGSQLFETQKREGS